MDIKFLLHDGNSYNSEKLKKFILYDCKYSIIQIERKLGLDFLPSDVYR